MGTVKVYSMRFFLCLVVCSLLVVKSGAEEAGTGSISGFVYDAADGEALISANVYLRTFWWAPAPM